MSDHIVNVRVDEMRAQDPDSVPTPQQQAEIREKLRAEFTASCVSDPVSREVFECWLKATSTRELADCAGESEGPLPAGGPDSP